MFVASIPSPPISTFEIGPFTIHIYALCLLAGIVIAAILANHRLKLRGVENWLVIDVAFFAVPLGIIGARVWHVLTHPADYFYEGADLLRTLYIWEGGIAIFGAIIGGVIGAWIGCRIVGLRLTAFVDAVAPGMLIAQAIGRLGNWFNHELFGLPTDLPWGLEIESTNAAWPVGLPEGTLFHPTFLYEIVWNLTGFVVLTLIANRYSFKNVEIAGAVTKRKLVRTDRFQLQWGRMLALYLIWYGTGRAFLEMIRIDPLDSFLGLRLNVWGAIFIVAVGIVLFIVQTKRHPGLEPSPYLPGRERIPEDSSENIFKEEDIKA